MYNDNSRIANNGGQVDTTLPSSQAGTSAAASSTAAAARPNPTHTNSFGQSAARIGEVMRSSWQSAAQSAINSVIDDFKRGGNSAVRPIDTALMSEQAGQGAAIRISQEFHRDSINAPYLRTMRTALGPPSTKTSLRNGTQFDTTSISSSKRTHRTANNHLVTDSNEGAAKRKKHAKPPRGSGPSKRLFPDQHPQEVINVDGGDDDGGGKMPAQAPAGPADDVETVVLSGDDDDGGGKMPAQQSGELIQSALYGN